MSNLDGKVICNAFMECNDHDNCDHHIPHERNINCRTSCGGGGVRGATCVPIQVYCIVNGKSVYCIKTKDGETHMIPKDPAPELPEFNMDERIYICPFHASCPSDGCEHKQFHNKLDECEIECHLFDISLRGVACREANNEEILQLFREQDDKVYSEFMAELIKPKPEKPKSVHERVQRFLNLEL